MDSIKRTIVAEGRNLTDADKREIIRKVKQTNPETLKSSRNGTHIILNKLPDSVVTDIYDFIRKRLNL
jgi:hypothetical protein